ncbi:MAG: hypothetical protein IJ387_07310 [Thermoguttaceae bacterium]|nr:hypothetical protein [Thermoguttaceae bacterium]
MARNVAVRRWKKRITVLTSAFVVAAFVVATGAEIAADETNGDAAVNVSETNGGNSGGVFHFDSSTRWPEWDSASETSLRFRVDAVVKFSRNEDEERSFRTSSVFFDDFAFDFIGDNGEIIVYSFSEKKFALIDPIRRLRTEVDAEEIDRFLENVKPLLEKRNDAFCAFMLEPSFEVSRKEDELLFQSKWIDYRATTRVFDDPKIAAAYFDFANALCKLNVFMNPGSVTPLARLELNRRFQEEARFPEKLVVDVYPKGKMFFNRSFQASNEYKLARRLSEKDRNRVMRAIHFAAQFQEVNFRTYYQKSNDR